MDLCNACVRTRLQLIQLADKVIPALRAQLVSLHLDCKHTDAHMSVPPLPRRTYPRQLDSAITGLAQEFQDECPLR